MQVIVTNQQTIPSLLEQSLPENLILSASVQVLNHHTLTVEPDNKTQCRGKGAM
jgi:hypothetical protein